MASLNSSLGVNMTNFWPGTNLTSMHDGQCYGNITLCLNNDKFCTLENCDLSLAQFSYIPNLGGNALFAAIFGICIALQVFFGIRHKTWGFMGATIFGFGLEIVGYIARILMHNDPFNNNDFLMYLVCLTIAPAFLSGAIYLCLARIVVVYGENLSRFKPRTYTIVFCTCDFISLLLQAIGGAIASVSDDQNTTQVGINIMIAGLSFQVVSLFVFAVACGEFAFRLYKSPQSWNARHAHLYTSKLFRAFLFGLAIATLTIFIRSCFRVAELSAGFNGPLANNQVSFMLLEGTMISIAAICISALHPGVCFKGVWDEANFALRSKKAGKGDLGSSESIESDVEANPALGQSYPLQTPARG